MFYTKISMFQRLILRVLTVVGIFAIFGTSLITAYKMSQTPPPSATTIDTPMSFLDTGLDPEIIEDIVYQEAPSSTLSPSATITRNQTLQENEKENEKEDEREDKEDN